MLSAKLLPLLPFLLLALPLALPQPLVEALMIAGIFLPIARQAVLKLRVRYPIGIDYALLVLRNGADRDGTNLCSCNERENQHRKTCS